MASPSPLRRIGYDDDGGGKCGKGCIVTSIAACGKAGGRTLVFSGCSDASLSCWDARTGARIQTIVDAHDDWIRCLEVSSDGGILFSGGRDKAIRVWRICWSGRGSDSSVVLKRAGVLKGHSDWVRCLSCPDGLENKCRLFSGSHDCTIREWDLSSFDEDDGDEDGVGVVGQCISVVRCGDWVRSFLVCLKTKTLYVGFMDFTVKRIQIGMQRSRGLVLQEFKGHGGEILCMCTSRLERKAQAASSSTSSSSSCRFLDVLYTGSDDCTIRQWHCDSGICLKVFRGHANWVRSVKVSGGARLYSGSEDATIKIWDTGLSPEHVVPSVAANAAGDVSESTTLVGHRGAVWDIEIAPQSDRTVLLSSSADGGIMVWKVRNPSKWTKRNNRMYSEDFKEKIKLMVSSPPHPPPPPHTSFSCSLSSLSLSTNSLSLPVHMKLLIHNRCQFTSRDQKRCCDFALLSDELLHLIIGFYASLEDQASV